MERLSGGDSATTSLRWEEVLVSSEKGRREIHYYVISKGRADLAVVATEKTLRHMSYHYALPNLPDSLPKLRSRRDVIHFLHSLSDASTARSSLDECKDACEFDVGSFKDMQSQNMGRCNTNFQWLGSSWSCRKKRSHYHSFQRNGVKISVHDFVYVLAEEDKRLVAYLEDMYEDSKGNKMVVVRWYHKIDEVGLVLPHNYNDREVFFSLCLQDLSIECIDGLATVLSPQHFDRFLNVARHMKLEPFVCYKQFENDDVEPFNITQVKGYWKQNILRYMYTISPSKDNHNSQQSSDDLIVEENSDVVGVRPRKRQCTEKRQLTGACFLTKGGIGTCSPASPPCNIVTKDNASGHYEVGSHVEVLSQDSGIRGCWFRASVIKKRNDKVKVRYEDIQDAVNEAMKLEEWILASRVATPDRLGLRVCGRLVVRPSPQYNKGQVSWTVDVGTVVDVWRHDGWWEGIVVMKESDDRFCVYFPGENQNSVFTRGELRHSQEWLANGWMQIKERQDVVPAILSGLETNQACHDNPVLVTNFDIKPLGKDESGSKDSCRDSEGDKDGKVKDLSKDNLLSQLKWKTFKKRRRFGGSSVQKLHEVDIFMHDGGAPRGNVSASRTRKRFMIPPSLKLDHENCKFGRDSLFSSSVVAPLTSLVMSR